MQYLKCGLMNALYIWTTASIFKYLILSAIKITTPFVFLIICRSCILTLCILYTGRHTFPSTATFCRFSPSIQHSTVLFLLIGQLHNSPYLPLFVAKSVNLPTSPCKLSAPPSQTQPLPFLLIFGKFSCNALGFSIYGISTL